MEHYFKLRQHSKAYTLLPRPGPTDNKCCQGRLRPRPLQGAGAERLQHTGGQAGGMASAWSSRPERQLPRTFRLLRRTRAQASKTPYR